MARYLYRPNQVDCDENGFVPAEQAEPLHSSDEAIHVISDTMDSIRHMADGNFYDSKAKFRAATRAAGCIEVGSEVATVSKPRAAAPLDRAKRREDIKRTIYELRNGIRR